VGLPIEAQLLGFTVLSGALFAASRTVFKHALMRRADRHPSGVDTLLGEEATVTQAIDARSGTVRLHGELWAARSLEGPIAEGERVRVEQVEGLKLHVRRQRAAIWDGVPKGN
jgi:membrane protein implicated in regulation of membrane protease activity